MAGVLSAVFRNLLALLTMGGATKLSLTSLVRLAAVFRATIHP